MPKTKLEEAKEKRGWAKKVLGGFVLLGAGVLYVLTGGKSKPTGG